MVISDPESPGDRLCLVELSPRPAQSRFTCANGWRFLCAARETRNRGRQPDCSFRSNQSISGACDYLFGLPGQWEGRGGFGGDPRILLLILPAPFRGFEGAWHDV